MLIGAEIPTAAKTTIVAAKTTIVDVCCTVEFGNTQRRAMFPVLGFNTSVATCFQGEVNGENNKRAKCYKCDDVSYLHSLNVSAVDQEFNSVVRQCFS